MATKKMTLKEALGQYSRVVNRIMTPDEARSKAEEMQLSEPTISFIVDMFTPKSWWDDDEDGVGEDGRMALGQSWDSVQADLAEAMGLDVEDPEVVRVFDAFFEE